MKVQPLMFLCGFSCLGTLIACSSTFICAPKLVTGELITPLIDTMSHLSLYSGIRHILRWIVLRMKRNIIFTEETLLTDLSIKIFFD